MTARLDRSARRKASDTASDAMAGPTRLPPSDRETRRRSRANCNRTS